MDDTIVPVPAGTPRHVVHRRNDGAPCFLGDEDYLVYLDCLKGAAERLDCAIHAYVLMPDHVQLLVSLDSETRLAQLLRGISGRYVEYVNYTYQRNGRFWEHRARVTAIESERDLLARYCAIETTPVGACLAARPEDYRWSSHRHHACGNEDTIIREHPWYLKLGATQLARQLAYHEWFHQLPDDEAAVGARTSSDPKLALGDNRLEDGIERSSRGRMWLVSSDRRRRTGSSGPLEGEDRVREESAGSLQARAKTPRAG